MRQLVYEKENSWFKPVKPHLKIDLVSYPVLAEVLVNRINLKVRQLVLEKENSELQPVKLRLKIDLAEGLGK